ncbi:MAG: DUF2341 domain-containing protein, partial [Patescibacteria group bacterium]
MKVLGGLKKFLKKNRSKSGDFGVLAKDKRDIKNLLKAEQAHVKELRSIDNKILRIQHSTKTNIPWLAPVHCYLRMRWQWYYRWHMNPWSSRIHAAILLVLFVTVTFYGTAPQFQQRAMAADNSWTGAGNNWSNAASWTLGHVPNDTEIARIDSNVTVHIDAAANVAGIIQSTGTLIQDTGIAVTVGSSGWSQTGGTFTGGNSAITNSGNFTLSGGVFTSTSGTLSTAGNWSQTDGTFLHNSGTVDFTKTSGIQTLAMGYTPFNNFAHSGAGELQTSTPSWQYRRVITIDHTKFPDVASPSATYANFPVMISASSLSNINALGTDIRFTDSAGTPLAREIESYASGALIAWVKFTPTKDAGDATDDTLYMYYGNSGAVEPTATSAYGKNSVWTSNYLGIYHLADAGPTNAVDSTSVANDGTQGGGVTFGASGKIGAATSYDGTDDIMTLKNYSITTSTIEMWINPDTIVNGDRIISNTDGAAGGFTTQFASSKIQYWNVPAGSWSDWSSTALSAGNWYHLAMVTSGGNSTLYINGAAGNTLSAASSPFGTLGLAAKFRSTYGTTFDGFIDETRVSNTALSAEWITAEYNNQSSPATFATAGVELGSVFNVSGSATVSAGTFNINGRNLTTAGVFTVSSGATFSLTGDETITNGTTTLASGSTVAYVATSGTRAIKNWSYPNLTINGSGGTFNLPADTTVSGNLTLTAGTLDVTASNYSLSVAGNWNNNGGSFTARSGTVTLAGAGGNVTSGAGTFNNLTLNSAPGDVSSGMVGRFNLDETSGNTVRDATLTNANNLTDNNTTPSVAGKVSNAANLASANNEYLRIVDNPSLRTGDIDFTVSGWVNLASKPEAGVIVGKWQHGGDRTQNEWVLEYDGPTSGDRFRFYVSSNGTAVSANASADNLGSPSLSTWYFIVAWHDAANNTINIQVNNGTVNTTSWSSGVFGGTSAFTIGSHEYSGTTYPWNGQIDEISFWRRTLTADEKTVLYNAGNGKAYSSLTSAEKASLVSYWGLDESSAGAGAVTRADSHGGIGVVTGATATTGVIGGGQAFNGSAYISAGNPSALNFNASDSFSINMWANSSNWATNYEMLFDKYLEATLKGYSLGADGTNRTLSFAIGGGSWPGNFLRVTTQSALSNSTWYHIVATYDGSESVSGVKIYVNGVSQTLTTVIDALSAADTTSTAPAQIGARNGSNYGFVGSIDDTRIYNRVLTQSEVSELYHGTYTLQDDLNVDGNLTLTAGTLDVSADNRNINVGGNFANSATFNGRSGTVTFDGASQTISGNTTFNNFATTTQDQTLSFAAASTQTISGTWTVTGADSHPITLQRSGGAGVWNVNPTTANISYATISNSTNLGSAITATNSTDGGGNTGWTIPLPFTLSGTCQKYDRSTNCAEGETVKVAVNGTVDNVNTGTTSSGSFSISGLTAPNSGDVITVFVSGVDDALEANAVTKYDGSGNITGMTLYEDHLTIGSGDNQTIANSDLANYDNSVSAASHNDIFFEVNADNDLSTDATDQTSQDTLLVLANNTYRPDSASSGNVGATHLIINSSGTITADGNSWNIAGNWTNSGSWDAGTSTVTFDGSSNSVIVTGGTGTTQDFNAIVVNKGVSTNYAQLSTNGLDVDSTLTVTVGVLDLNGQNISTTTTMTVANGATLKQTGDETISATPTLSATCTVEYTATSGTRNIRNWTYTNAIVKINGTGGTFTLPGDKTLGGLTVSAGTFDISTRLLTVSGATTLNGGDLTGTIAMDFNGGLTISDAGSALTAASHTLVAGTYEKSAGTTDWTTNSSGFYILPNSDYAIPTDTYYDLYLYNQGMTYRTLSLSSGTTTIRNLTITPQSVPFGEITLAVGAETLTASGNISTSYQNAEKGKITVTSGTINVGGNWSNAGSFTAGTGTVTFTGSSQTISGNTTFNNFTKTNSTNDATDAILAFTAGTTQTVGGLLTLDGLDDDDRVNLVSSSSPTRWNLAANGTFAIDYADVTDSNATGLTPTYTNTNDGGNNVNWGFGITISGTCQKYNRSTNCASDETIAVAVNGEIQTGKTATTNFDTGTFSISGVTTPNSGDTITVFVSGVDDALEANAVTKYDGSGSITGVKLYEDHLTIGSEDNQTVANSDLDSYDNSVSVNEDIFFEVNADNDLSTDATDQTSQDTLLVLANNTYRPDSASSGNVGATHLIINSSGTITADGNNFTIPGNWTNSGTFTADTSTVTISGSGTSTFTGNTSFNSLTCAVAGKQLTFTAGSTQTIGGVLTLTGTYSNMILLRSSSSGSAYTIVKNGTTNIDWVDVKDSTATNAITATDGTNNTGNTNWTFTYENRYRIGAGGNWNNTNYWSKTSGGATGESTPGVNNNAYFDSNSSSSCTLGASASVRNIYSLGGYAGTLTTNSSLYSFTIGGAIEWDAGTLTISSPTTISNSIAIGGTATFNINHAQALGSAAMIINGGTIDNSSGTSITLSTTNAQTWNSSFAFAGTTNLTFGPGSITLANDVTVTTNGSSVRVLAVGNVIGGNYSLAKSGPSRLQLSGANTFGGSGKSITLNAGYLYINNASALGDAANVFIVNGGTIDNTSGSTVTMANNYLMQWNASFSYTGNRSIVFGTGSVTLGTNCTVTSGSSNYPLTVGGAISGSYNIIKAGVGALTLSGANSFVGSLTIDAGTLTLPEANAFTGDVTLNAGTLTLSGANTFLGDVTLNAGTININHATALGNAANTLVINGGTIDNSTAGNITLSNNYPVQINASFAFTGTRSLLFGTGAVTLGANCTFTLNGSTSYALGFSGVVSGNFGIIKESTGGLILGGANDFTGGVTLNAGRLYINHNTAIGTGTLVINGGDLENSSSGTVTLTNNNAQTWNASSFSFNLYHGDQNLNLGSGAVTLGANCSVLSYNSRILTVGGVISGDYKLTQAGPATLEITGSNSYTGGTTVSAGYLIFSNGSLGTTGNITFSNGTLRYASGNTQDISGRIKSSGSAIKIDTNSNNVTFASTIDNSNTAGLTKSGAGVVTLNAANTYLGTTSLDGGALNINNPTAVSSGTLNLNAGGGVIDNTSGAPITLSNNNPIILANSITFTGSNSLNLGTGAVTISGGNRSLDQNGSTLTVGGIIDDGVNSYKISKSGVGTLTLNGANTFDGGFSLYGGTLNLGHASALGTGTFTFVNAGTSFDNTSGAPMTLTNNNAIVFGNTSPTFIGSNDLDLGTGGGTITASSGSGFTVNSHTLTINGVISGAKTFSKAGVGTLTLGGANTFSNGMTVSAGTLNINHAQAIGSGTFTISGGTIDNTSGTSITLANNNVMAWNGDFAFTGTNDLNLGTGVPTLNANRSVTVNGGTLTVGGAMTGGGNARTLTKNGNGTLVVGASPGYMGSWTVSGGTIRAEAALTLNNATQDLAITSGTLDLNGQDLTVNDQFTIGAAGVLKMTGDEAAVSTLDTITEGATIEYHATSGTRDIKNWTYTNATLWINGAGGTFTLPTNLTARGVDIDNGTLTQSSTHSITVGVANFDVSNGNFSGGSGTVDINGNLALAGGTFTSTSGQLQVSGDWTKSSGAFTHNSGTVVFDGTSQTISGSTTFNAFSTTTQDQTLSFNAGDTQTIAGTWTVTGAADHLIALQRSGGSGQWNVLPQGSVNISYANVSNSNNQGTAILPTNSTNGGGNTGWFTTTPTVTTQAATTVLQTTIVANGTTTATGGANATVRGFKYGLTETDTWDSYDSGDFGAEAFTKTITGLTLNTTYYIRAYATNSIGTSYGSYVSFTTSQVPAVQFTLASSSGAESTLSPSIEISIPSQSSENVSVSYAVTGGTATGSGTDYTLASGTATITAGGTTTTLPLSIANDLADEVDEAVIMTISSPTNATLGANTAHTYTITDDDNAPSVTLSLADSPLAENGGVAVATATLSAVSGKSVTVNLAYSGTATNITDYTRSSASIVVAAGELTGTASLTGVDDSLDESDETMIVDIDSITNGTEATPQQVTAYITDDDGTPTIAFSAATASGSEATTSVTLTVNLSNASSQEITAGYTVTGTASGSGTDYTLANGVATIAAEATSTTIPLTIVNDTLDENDETVIVTLSNPANAGLGVNSAITYTITDNDNPAVIQFSSTTSGNAESTTSVNIAVSLDVASGLATSAQYTLSGTATGSGTDYTLAAGTAEIAAGETSVNIPVTIVNDALDEDNETIILTLSNPANSSLGSNTTHTYTITDDDATPSITFDTDAESGAESVTSKSITLSLSAVSGRNITVSYALSGTAAGSGTDYTLANGTATVAAGQASTTLGFAVVDDPTDELDETVVIDISNPTNVALGATTEYTYTIADNDNPPTVGFLAASSSGLETVVAPTITVSLSLASAKEITVAYATSDGTAEAGSDYTAASGTLTFAAGETSKSIALAVTDNGVVEADETLVATLSDPSNATIGANQTHTYTITNDDTNPTGTISINDAAAKSNATTVTLSVTTDKAPQMKVANSESELGSADYETFATTKSWVLAAGADSIRTVYLKLKDQYGNESEVISDTIVLDTTAPALPTGLVAVSGNTSISLSWTNPTDSDFVNIAIFRSTTENFTPDLVANKIASTTTTSEATYVDTTAENNTTYYYAIKALDDADNYSSASTQVSGKPDSDNPTTPGSPTITERVSLLDSKEIVNKKDIAFTWNLSTDDNSGIKAYYLSIGRASGLKDVVDSQEILVSTLTNADMPTAKYQLPTDGIYYARIQAKDNLGNTSSYSSELAMIVDTEKPQMSETMMMFDASDRASGKYAVALVWPLAKEDGSGLLGYAVAKDDQSIVAASKLITEKVTEDKLSGYAYYFDGTTAEESASYSVVAIDRAQNVSGRLEGILADTTVLKTTNQQAGSKTIKLSSSVIGEGKLEITDINAMPSEVSGKKTQAKVTWKTTVPSTSQVEYGQGSDYTNKTVLDSGLNSTHTVILSDLVPNTTYHYRIITKDKHGNEVVSPDQSLATKQVIKDKGVLEIILQNITDAFSGIANAIKNLLSYSAGTANASNGESILSVINISTPDRPANAIYWEGDGT